MTRYRFVREQATLGMHAAIRDIQWRIVLDLAPYLTHQLLEQELAPAHTYYGPKVWFGVFKPCLVPDGVSPVPTLLL